MDEKFFDAAADQYEEAKAAKTPPFVDAFTKDCITAEQPSIRGEQPSGPRQPRAFADLYVKMKEVRPAKEVTRDENLTEMRVLSGVENTSDALRRDEIYTRRKRLRKKENTTGMEKMEAEAFAANWEKGASDGLRKTWAKLAREGNLKHSGLPLFLQKVVDGACDEYEVEVHNYLKLAGLNYVMTEAKLQASVKEITDMCLNFQWEVASKLESLLEQYQQLQFGE